MTFAAAFAPLLAFDEVAILVLTLVFVKVCDSELESDAAEEPASAAEPPFDFDPPFADVSDLAKTVFLVYSLLRKRI